MTAIETYKKDMQVGDGIVRKAQIINFFGAAGSGKSTVASGLHYELKKQWVHVEIAREYAKDVVHQETTHWFEQAVLVLAEQSARIQFIADKYDYVITDGPIMLTSWYAPKKYYASFHNLCLDLFNAHNNLNFFLYRNHPYDPNGRLETEKQARHAEEGMVRWLHQMNIPFEPLYSKDDNVNMLCDLLLLGKPLPPVGSRPVLSISPRT